MFIRIRWTNTPHMLSLMYPSRSPQPLKVCFWHEVRGYWQADHDSDDRCTKCSSIWIILTAGGTPWCICSLNAVNRQVAGLRKELAMATERIEEVEGERGAEKVASEKLRRELRRTKESMVSSLFSCVLVFLADKPTVHRSTVSSGP